MKIAHIFNEVDTNKNKFYIEGCFDLDYIVEKKVNTQPLKHMHLKKMDILHILKKSFCLLDGFCVRLLSKYL